MSIYNTPYVSARRGLYMLIASNLIFCLNTALLKSVSHISSYKSVFWRFLVGLTIMGILAMTGRIKLTFQDKPLLFLRGLIGGTATVLCYIAITHLGLIKGTIIFYTFPVFSMIFGALILKEKIGLKEISLTLLAIGGFILMSSSRGDNHISIGVFTKYELIALIGSVMSGLTLVIIKKLRNTDSSNSIFFSQCLIGIMLVMVPGGIGSRGGDTAITLTSYDSMLLIIMGVLAAAAQLIMTKAYKYVPVTKSSLMFMIGPVINFLIGMTIFKESISFMGITGMIIIIISSTAAVVKKSNRVKTTTKQPA